MNQIVGGGPQARLFLDLREEHSLTYGAYSRFTADVYPGDWQASSPVRTKVTKDAMDRFTYEFKKINNEPVPQCPNSMTRIAPSSPASLYRSSSRAKSFRIGSPSSITIARGYWDKYPDQIFAVGAPGVQSAAKKFVDLDHLQWIWSVTERRSRAM